MPTRACLSPTCPNPATYRGRCQRHARQRERATHPNKSFYNSKKWKHTRRKQLLREPICQHPACKALATDVDHRTPIEQGGDKWSLTNLQSLCRSHHGQKTRREQGATE